jgi:thiamine-phosphate pyrophosphorylase
VFPSLYAIMDADLLQTSELAYAESLAESGVELIQYRNKRISSGSYLRISQALVAQLRPRGVRFIVNDRPDIAALAGAYGVHVGQQDLSPEQARAVCGSDSCVGVSTHTLEQVREAEAATADYVAVGPIFPTVTKSKPDPVVGTEFIREARRLTRKPLVAIGGITLDRAEEVFRAGADSLAVARDLLTNGNPAQRALEFLALAARFREEGKEHGNV